MTAALVSDTYGETNNAVNYVSIYAWKGARRPKTPSPAAGRRLIMTGTLIGNAPSTGWFGPSLRRPRSARWPRLPSGSCASRLPRSQMSVAVHCLTGGGGGEESQNGPKPAIA